MAKIYILDVTNRDGVQTSRICLSKLQKTMLNMHLDQMGIFQSEYGFPTTNHEINYLNANLELVKKGAIKRLCLSGWVRAIKSDVEIAFKNVPKLEYMNIIYHMELNLMMDIHQKIFIKSLKVNILISTF